MPDAIGPKYSPPMRGGRFQASKAAPKPKKGKGNTHLSDTHLEEEDSYSHARDEKTILYTVNAVHDGLHNFGDYSDENWARVMNMFEREKEAFCGEFSHHKYDDIEGAWKSLCQKAMEYLTWAKNCEIELIPRDYVEANKLSKDLEKRAVSTAYAAADAKLLKKYVLKKKTKSLMKKSRKIGSRAAEIRESSDARLSDMRKNTPASQAFHTQITEFDAQVKKHFPSAKSSIAISIGVENWVKGSVPNRCW